MVELMSYKEVIKKIKEETNATDEEIEKNAEEIEKRFGPIIKTQDFLYYLVAEHKYNIKLPKITEISDNGGGERKEPIDLKLNELNRDRADSLIKNRQSINVEGFIFDQLKTPTRKGSEKYNFTIVSEDGSAIGLTAGDEATQIWDDADVRPHKYVQIKNSSVFLPSPKALPRISISRFSEVKVLKVKKNMEDIISNISEDFAKDGDIVYAEGFVTDVKKGNEYIGCTKCSSKMVGKDGKILDECPKCKNTESKKYHGLRINIFDGTISSIVNMPPIMVDRNEDDFMRQLVRMYGKWKEDRKEMSYIKHKILDGFKDKKASPLSKNKVDKKTEPKKTKPKEDEKDQEKNESNLSKKQKSVFEGTVKQYGRASKKIVIKHLKKVTDDEKEIESIIKSAIDEGFIKYFEEEDGTVDDTVLEWCSE